jgi:hypothetical protein
MRAWICLALLTLMAMPAVSATGQARVETLCPAFARPCDCVWHARDCLPTCRIQPRIECAPASP